MSKYKKSKGKSAKFDIILCMEVIEHVQDYEVLLS